MRLYDGRADYLIIQNDCKRTANVLGCEITEFASSGRIETECHRRLAILIKRRQSNRAIPEGMSTQPE